MREQTEEAGDADARRLLERAEAAERDCAVRDAALRTICEYLERELHRARTAAQGLANAPNPLDREAASARAHEMTTVTAIVKRAATLVSQPEYVESWVSPQRARQVHHAFLACLQQLQDQQAMRDENGWEEYRAALALLCSKATNRGA